jgi:hypothetical protein
VSVVRKWNLTALWNDDRIERWLETMARQGLHLEKVSWGGLFTFRRGAPSRATYRIDIADYRKGLDIDYLQLMTDAGWRMAAQWSTWYFWRNDAPGTPEIFTDAGSRAQKYRRMRSLVLLCSLPQLPFMLNSAITLYRSQEFPGLAQALLPVATAAILFNVYGYVRLKVKLRTLERTQPL